MDAQVRTYPTPLNSTFLPMLLLSLTKQKNTPDTAKLVQSEYDYIIVGAGTAGSVVASRLSEVPCVRVLLLEDGGPPPELTDIPAMSRYFRGTDIDWNFETVPQKHTGLGLFNQQLKISMGRALGGSSVLNDMLYVRGNRNDYDGWAEDGAEGWSYEDVLPYFKKMEGNRDRNFVSNGFHGMSGPLTVQRAPYQSPLKLPLFKTAESMGYNVVDANGARQTGFYDVQSTLRGGQRCSTAKAYLVPAENRSNLDIVTNAMVQKILFENERAVGVEYEYQDDVYEVKATREVIVSAGPLKTPQLLLLSGIGPREELEQLEIPVIADLPVGRNLQDHPVSFVNFHLRPNITSVAGKLQDEENLKQFMEDRTGPLASPAFVAAAAFLKSNATAPEDDFPDHQLTFAEGHLETFLGAGFSPDFMSAVFNPHSNSRPFYTCFCSVLHPRSKGHLSLMSTNPYDPPLIDPNYYDDPRDLEDMVEGLKTCLRIGRNPVMRRSVGSAPFKTLVPECESYVRNEDKYLECTARSAVLTFSHPVGTARMGDPQDPRTVVDPLLRVLNVEGLRIVDASIMPTIPSGSTYIPTVMVAEKASDIIKSTIECHEKNENQEKEMNNIRRSGEIIQKSENSYLRRKQIQEPLIATTNSREFVNPYSSHSIKVDQSIRGRRKMDLSKSESGSKWFGIPPSATSWEKEIPWNKEFTRANILNLAINQTQTDILKTLLSGSPQTAPVSLPSSPQHTNLPKNQKGPNKRTRNPSQNKKAVNPQQTQILTKLLQILETEPEQQKAINHAINQTQTDILKTLLSGRSQIAPVSLPGSAQPALSENLPKNQQGPNKSTRNRSQNKKAVNPQHTLILTKLLQILKTDPEQQKEINHAIYQTQTDILKTSLSGSSQTAPVSLLGSSQPALSENLSKNNQGPNERTRNLSQIKKSVNSQQPLTLTKPLQSQKTNDHPEQQKATAKGLYQNKHSHFKKTVNLQQLLALTNLSNNQTDNPTDQQKSIQEASNPTRIKKVIKFEQSLPIKNLPHMKTTNKPSRPSKVANLLESLNSSPGQKQSIINLLQGSAPNNFSDAEKFISDTRFQTDNPFQYQALNSQEFFQPDILFTTDDDSSSHLTDQILKADMKWISESEIPDHFTQNSEQIRQLIFQILNSSGTSKGKSHSTDSATIKPENNKWDSKRVSSPLNLTSFLNRRIPTAMPWNQELPSTAPLEKGTSGKQQSLQYNPAEVQSQNQLSSPQSKITSLPMSHQVPPLQTQIQQPQMHPQLQIQSQIQQPQMLPQLQLQSINQPSEMQPQLLLQSQSQQPQMHPQLLLQAQIQQPQIHPQLQLESKIQQPEIHPQLQLQSQIQEPQLHPQLQLQSKIQQPEIHPQLQLQSQIRQLQTHPQLQKQQSPQPQNAVSSSSVNLQKLLADFNQKLSLIKQSEITSDAKEQMKELQNSIKRLMGVLTSSSSERRSIKSSSDKNTEDLRSLPCDKDICSSLVEFMRCRDASCQSKKEFSAFIYKHLCSS